MFRLLVLMLCLCNESVLTLVCNEYNICSVGPISSTTETNRFTSRRPVWLESCNCDQNCYSFGDCCLDAPSLHSKPLKDWSILNVRISPKFTYHVLMKTKCPEEWRNEKVKQMCENIGFEESQDFFLSESAHFESLPNDEFLLWQVTGKTTLITYRNMYCALCNNDTQLESWNQKLRCSASPDGQRCSMINYPSPPEFLIQEKVQRKPYQIQIYSICDMGWYKANIQINAKEIIDTIKNCTRFYAPVVVQDNSTQKLTAFKNEFCAKCNGYDHKVMLCPSESENFYEHENPIHSEESITFDTNFMTGGYIHNKNTSCPAGQVYNPLDSKCRVILIEDTKQTNDEEMINYNEDTEDDETNDESDNSHSNASYDSEMDVSSGLSKHSNQSNRVFLRSHEILSICLTILINCVTNGFVLALS